nr:NAD(P)H-dependent oxidoreductase [Terribacillus saccharophilus]
MTIVLLNGSLNPASTTKKLLEQVKTLLQKANYETEIINIGELESPFSSGPACWSD